jgi:hypothetical protein
MKCLILFRDLVLVIVIEHLLAFFAGLVGVEQKIAVSQWFHCLVLIVGLTAVAYPTTRRRWSQLCYLSGGLLALSICDTLLNRRSSVFILEEGLIILMALLCSCGLLMLFPRKAGTVPQVESVGSKSSTWDSVYLCVAIAAVVYYLWFLWRGIDR